MRDTGVRFSDIAGLDHIVMEMREIVKMLLGDALYKRVRGGGEALYKRVRGEVETWDRGAVRQLECGPATHTGGGGHRHQ